jgi:hypothetical protein
LRDSIAIWEKTPMAVQVVMDHSGDTRHWYDTTDERSLLEAKERFRQLSEQGYTAAVAVPKVPPE